MKIVKLNKDTLSDVNQPNEPFPVIGRIIPEYINGQWRYTEQLSEPYMKQYPNDDDDWTEYIEREDREIYLAYLDGICVGQIILRADWNRYAFIEDICVSAQARGRGIGTALIQHAECWAKEHNLCGLALETQDNNVLACRFYAKCGFSIGAVNTMLYRNFPLPWGDEIAIFWYKKI